MQLVAQSLSQDDFLTKQALLNVVVKLASHSSVYFFQYKSNS